MVQYHQSELIIKCNIFLMIRLFRFSDKLLVKSVCIISLLLSLFILLNPIKTPGGELLFLLPLALCVCTLLFPNLIRYQKDGWGLKIFYIVICVRYLLVPFITCIEGKFATGGLTCYGLSRISMPESYRYAIIAMIIELITSLFVINKYYDRTYKIITTKLASSKQTYQSLSIIGLLLSLFFVYLIISRGGIANFIRIGVVTEELDYDSQTGHHGIDVEIIKPLLGFLVITITGFFQKQYDKTKSFVFFIIPMIVAMLSCIIIVGNNRMQMVYLALCAIAVLTKAFPAYDKSVKSVILPTLLVILISFTLLKQFGLSLGSDNISYLDKNDQIVGLTEYVCGPENTAHTFDNCINRCHNVSLSTIIADFLKYNHSLRLPILNELQNTVAAEQTVIDYAVDATEMISVAGQCAFYGHGAIGGWWLTMLSFFGIARLLVYFEIKSKTSEDLGTVYIFNWCAILFGVSMCYCLVTLWDNITYVPIWIWALLKLNNIGRNIAVR